MADNSKTPPDAETTEEFRTRVLHSLFKILLEHLPTSPLQNNQLKPLIIVSHQKVFEYLAYFLVNRSEKLSQGGIGHFALNKDGTWELNILTPKI